MDKIIIISLIIFTIVVVCIIVMCKYNLFVMENMDNINYDELNYADDNDEYNYPFILNNLLAPDYLEKIKEKSLNSLIDSMVVSGKIDSIRNSKQTWINKNDPLVKPIFEHLSKFFNIPFENAEDLQIVRYLPNQYYKDHHDSCCDKVNECNDFVKRGGQRILTVLIYLNDNFKGGETNFTNLNIKYKAKPGDAIVFYPLNKQGKYCHPKALHAGLPVTQGEKWIANVWFREREFK